MKKKFVSGGSQFCNKEEGCPAVFYRRTAIHFLFFPKERFLTVKNLSLFLCKAPGRSLFGKELFYSLSSASSSSDWILIARLSGERLLILKASVFT